MRKSSILLLCLMSSAGLLSCANDLEFTENTASADPVMRTVLELSADIRSVSTSGLWSYGGKEGWIRFVVIGGGVEHYHTRLYLQWFSQSDDGAQIELLSTVPVVELNGPAADPAQIRHYSFDVPECKDKTACTCASLEAFDTRLGDEKRFLLLLDEGPGRYRLTPQVPDDT